ncbi:MAG: AMP-binding protein, partial [Acidobacteriota bacterium]
MASRLTPDAVATPKAANVLRAYHLVDVLRERARRSGQAPAYTFLDDGEAEGGGLSWAQLDRAARAIAVHLAEVARPGDRALLLFPAGLDFIAAFFGCLYAGVVAVPSYPPRPNRGQQRLRAIVRDAAPAVVLAQKALLPRAAALVEDVPELAAARWLATDDLGGGEDLDQAAEAAQAADVWRDPGIRPDHLAFLQYTSGSTSLPKGVRVSHANLIANERMIQAAFRQSEESVVVGWLPLYHDMGLIGNVLQPLWSGGRCVLMSPVAFLQKPLRWLAAISRYRATTSGGPNFAYDLCARKIAPDDRAGLDLSSWRVAYNGAEPVRPATLDRFAAAFAGSGFSPAAFYPCYGLAEATLFVSGGVPGAGARATRFDAEELRHGRAVVRDEMGQQALVACGDSWLEQRLAIVDPESREELAEGRVGEIWIAGPNVGGGYWGRQEASAETFAATTAAGAGPYLRTGDLGFRQGGELFVAGRIKDLIILRGRNLYPQDLEETAERAHPGLRAGSGAAFSIPGGTEGDEAERLVLVYEVDRRAGPEVHEQIAVAVRAAIAEEHEAQVADLVLVKIGGVPKTSSGKVQRHASREGYLAGSLPVVARSAAAGETEVEATAGTPTGPAAAPEPSRAELAALPAGARRRALEKLLAAWAGRALGVPAGRIERAAPLSGYGLDSLAALELRSAVEERLGAALPLATLLEGATLGDLATLIGADLEGAAVVEAEAAPSEPESDRGTLPLSYGQEGLWVVERLAPQAGAYNLAAAFRVLELPADGPERLCAALRALVARHAALRLRLVVEDGAPRQFVAAAANEELATDLDFAVEDLGGRSVAEALADLSRTAYLPFDLERGARVRARLVRGAGSDLLLFAVHHSSVDFASFGTIARDLAALWTGGAHAALAPLAPETSYASWIRWQRELLAGPEGERLRAFWRERLGSGVADLDLPTDRPRPAAHSFVGTVARAPLPRETAARLEALARKGGATPQAALLAAFAAELARTAGQDDFALGVPTAGRTRSRFAETVGYFANPVAVRARTAGDPSFRELLERTRDELLGALEHADDPFPLIAAERVPSRDADRSPLFQAMLVHHAARGAADPAGAALAAVALGQAGAQLAIGALSLISLELPEPRAQFDLTLRSAANAGAGTLAFALEANAELFDRATAMRLLDRFVRLLSAAAAAPETALSALPRLSPAERHQLRVEWNDRGAADLSDLCLHELFLAQAARTPEAEALVATTSEGTGRLSYGELRQRVARMAGALVARGAGPEIRVAVCLSRSADLVAALLAVLEAGSAYVPLDPTYPRERLALMLADSRARLLITEDSCLAALPEALPETLRVDRPADLPIGPPVGPMRAPRVQPDNLAYLIYTSGSTGRPKAVAIAHRAAVALALWARRELSDVELSGVAAVTSVCFDLSVFELFVPLAWGGKTILAENALALPAHPARAEISLINTVPSAMAELARLDVAFPSLRAVILAGEPLPGELVERIYRMTEGASGPARASPVLTVRNLYGPSEDTTYSTGAIIPRGEARPW